MKGAGIEVSMTWAGMVRGYHRIMYLLRIRKVKGVVDHAEGTLKAL